MIVSGSSPRPLCSVKHYGLIVCLEKARGLRLLCQRISNLKAGGVGGAGLSQVERSLAAHCLKPAPESLSLARLWLNEYKPLLQKVNLYFQMQKKQ